jgi:hypothetical protein
MLKSKSRPAARRRPARARLGLEQLEGRLVPTVGVFINNARLFVEGTDNANHTIILDHTGPNNGTGTTSVQADNGQLQSFADSSITGGIFISDGNGNGTINIRATALPTFVEGLGGFDQVTLGKGGNMQGIQGPVTITHFDAVGNIALTLDDSNDPVDQNVTMGVSNGFGTITGLSPGTISYKAADVGSVTINGGNGGSTFTVADTIANNRAEFLGTTINTGTGGGAIVNVLGTTGALNIHPQGTVGAPANDRINVGNAHSVQGIHGRLAVFSRGANAQFFFLTLDDSADKTARTVTTTAGDVLGLAPAPFFFGAQDTISLEIDGGSGGNTFLVQGLPPLMAIRGGTGNDTFTVGSPNNTLDNIHGILVFIGQGPNDTVNINDQGTTTPESYTIKPALASVVESEVTRDDGKGFEVNVGGTTKHIVLNAGSGGNTFTVQDTSHTADTTINTGRGNNTVNIQGTTGPLTVNGQGGFDTVDVGLNGSVQGINGALTVTNTASRSSLSVDDHLDHVGRVVTMDVANGIGTITGISPAKVAYAEAAVSSINVNGGNGGNTFIVENTANNSASPLTILTAGAGKNSVTVRRTSGPLLVDGQGGADLVDVGGGSVQNIKAPVTVGNLAGFSTLVVDNSADTVNRVMTMSVGTFGTIAGLAPATISYLANEVNQVQVLGGNGTNQYTINNTVSNSSNPTTILRGGTGNDTFNLRGSTGTLQIDGGGGSDVINVGNTPTGAANVKGTLGLGDTGGKIRLEVFDGGDTASRTVQVTDHSVLGLAGQISFNPAQLTSATLRLDGAPDNVFVSSTPAGVPMTIVDGGNIDVIRVGSAANTLDGIQGPLTVDGSISGINVLIINDQGSTTPHTYTQTPTTLSRSGAATISFFNVESVSVNKGPVASPPAAKDLKLTPGPKGSRYVTLTGQLTDADPAAPLALTVNWGDGTQPQTVKPGQLPFKLKHHYARKGTYTVRAVWTDLKTHLSNSQDLRVTVA